MAEVLFQSPEQGENIASSRPDWAIRPNLKKKKEKEKGKKGR
jgi:hypothetical protein